MTTPPNVDEIARLRHDLDVLQARVTANSGTPASSSDELTLDFVDEYVRPGSAVGRAIERFRNEARAVPPFRHVLTNEEDYDAWSEAFMRHASSLNCKSLLVDHRTPEGPQLQVWRTYNQWLYNEMWNALSLTVQSRIVQPESGHAHDLWVAIRNAFHERDDVRRYTILDRVLGMTSRSKYEDRIVVENMMRDRVKLRALGQDFNDAFWFDTIKRSVSPDTRTYIHHKMDEALLSQNIVRPDEDLRTFLSLLYGWLPPHDSRLDSPCKPGNVRTLKDQAK
ncbi:hypothetical protein KEM52_000896 [Ascosphaera acerosa]|nr:hypothetical protein KEM52_000896 [Ascosphaera acerosa]